MHRNKIYKLTNLFSHPLISLKDRLENLCQKILKIWYFVLIVFLLLIHTLQTASIDLYGNGYFI